MTRCPDPGSDIRDKPLAAAGLRSWRYRQQFGFIMIGARDRVDAISEAQRSSSLPVRLEFLEMWCAERGAYVPAFTENELAVA